MGIATQKELNASQVPQDVLIQLSRYMEILIGSESVEDAGKRLADEGIIGGDLIDRNGRATQDILRFSLKKDFNNVKFYSYPPVITRVVYYSESSDGYEPYIIRGERYKIWVDKKDSKNGMPAPIPLIKTVDGQVKVVATIGSL